MKSKIIKIVRIIWVLAGITFTVWAYFSFEAKNIDDTVLQSNTLIKVEETDTYFSFSPSSPTQNVIFFYPGALVDPVAYTPLCRKIAENGHHVLIIKMPWRMATKGYEQIKDLEIFNDHQKEFILIGHSQGGKMAAQFVYENPNTIDKLILLGTTHPRDFNLSRSTTHIMKIFGSHDGIAPKEKVISNKSKLPVNTKYAEIDGGNHSQFGYYGTQFNDDKAGITREKQQELILEYILDFIYPN